MSDFRSAYVFRHGVMSPLDEDRLGDVLPTETLDDALDRMEYRKIQTVGDNNGLHYVLYESNDSGWVVCLGTTDKFCLVWCDTWHDLVGMLEKVSGIVHAARYPEDDK